MTSAPAASRFLWKPSDEDSVLLNVHARSNRRHGGRVPRQHPDQGQQPAERQLHPGQGVLRRRLHRPVSAEIRRAMTASAAAPRSPYFVSSGMTLTSITGYRSTHGFSRGDIDGGTLPARLARCQTGVTSAVGTCLGGPPAPPSASPFPGSIAFPSEHAGRPRPHLHQFTQELHLASTDADGPLFWQVGGFFFDHQIRRPDQPLLHRRRPSCASREHVLGERSAEANYAFTDAFKVTAGVRWTSDVKALTANGGGFFGVSIVTPVKLRGNNVSWDVSAAYALSDDVNLYARVATGFRAPSIQGRNLAFGGGFSTARSETVTSYEAGVKSELLGHTLRLNMDGFYYYLAHPQFSAIGGVGNSVYPAQRPWRRRLRSGSRCAIRSDRRAGVYAGAASWRPYRDPRCRSGPAVRRGGGRGAGRAGLYADQPLYAGHRGRVRQRQPFPEAPEARAELQRRNTPGRHGQRRAVIGLHRLVLAGVHQLLPLQVGGIPHQRQLRRRPEGRLHLPRQGLGSRALHPQHHRPGEPAGRHRLQQPDESFVSDPRVMAFQVGAHMKLINAEFHLPVKGSRNLVAKRRDFGWGEGCAEGLAPPENRFAIFRPPLRG